MNKYGLELTTVPRDLYYTERALVEGQAAEIKRQAEVIAKMHAALAECEDYFDNRADVVDGVDRQRPNTEMRLLSEVREALKAGG